MSHEHKHRSRFLINTDAKNEADDQYAIVHALLTPSFEIEGIIPAHFGDVRSPTSRQDSREEVERLLKMMNASDGFRLADGADSAMPEESTPVPSPGAELIIEAALRDDPRPLHIGFYGPLTDMASALLMEPSIEQRDIRVIWIGGGAWPNGGPEFNLSNDIASANLVFGSGLEVWQIPRSVYRRMEVSYAELELKVGGCGELGRYLVDGVYRHNDRYYPGPVEHRALGDSPAVGVTMYPDCGSWSMRPAPRFAPDMHYVHDGSSRDIRVYDDIDARFVHEDFFAKLQKFNSDGRLPCDR